MTSILFATTIPTTLQAFLLPLADACRSRGWVVDAVAADASSAQSLVSHFDRVYDAPWSRNPLAAGNLRAVQWCGRLLAEGRYDLVHVHTPVAAFVTRLAAMRAGFPGKIVYTAHGFHFVRGGSPLANLAYLSLEKLVAPCTDRLIVINREDQAAVLRRRLVAPDRLILMDGVGVDPERFSQARVPQDTRCAMRERLRLGNSRVVTMVAEFNPGKRHVDLLRAAPVVLRVYPDVTFLFAGKGPMLETSRTLARQLGIEDRVRFLGHWAEMPLLLGITDMVVLPSLREGLPVSLMEAMAMELPFVGTDVRGIRDLADGECGLLVPPKSPRQLAEAILGLLSCPDRMRTIGQRGRRRVLDKYRQDLIVERQIQLYSGLLME